MSAAYLTPEEVAQELSVKPATVLNWGKVGTLRGSKIGPGRNSPVRILRADVDAMIAASEVRPDA